jgi:hypothetical protein
MQQQTRNGITLVEDPWMPEQEVRAERTNVSTLIDTIRNPKFAPFRPKKFFDDGGRFYRWKSTWVFNDDAKGIITPWAGNTRMRYGLTVALPVITDNGFNMRDSLYPDPADYDLSAWHPKAFGALRPDKPLIDLFTFFVELRDLASLNFKSIYSLRGITDWWLATNFGWRPLLADIMRMYKVYNKLTTILDSLISNNGLPIRRSAKLYEFADPVTYFTQTNDVGINYNTWVQWPERSPRTSSWKFKTFRERQTKVWASGSFVFYMKDVQLPQSRRLLAVDLLGLRPTPAIMWNAMPWSWLIDWLSNVGDVLNNISAQADQRCVAQYLYLMRHTTTKYTWHGTDGWYTCSATHEFDSKTREPGHPFGLTFGSNLTSLQMSILAALAARKF